MTLAYMYGYGYGFGSNWLILVGVPLIIGLIGAVPGQERFQEMGRGPRHFEHHRRGSGP